MTTAEMQALIDRLEGHLAWINDFGPDGTLKVDLRTVVDYLKRVCPPRESVFADGAERSERTVRAAGRADLFDGLTR